MADEEILAYCVKEKAKKPMKDAHEVTLRNGKKALQGVCASCGTKMMKFISSKKKVEIKEAAPTATESKMAEENPSEEPLTAPTM